MPSELFPEIRLRSCGCNAADRVRSHRAFDQNAVVVVTQVAGACHIGPNEVPSGHNTVSTRDANSVGPKNG